MRRVMLLAGATLAALALVLVANTLRFESRQMAVEPLAPMALDGDVPLRLAAALRFRTVSHQDPAELDGKQFAGLRRWLEKSFPRVHRALSREAVAEHSALFTWTGRERDLPPVLLLAHLDVVPVDPVTQTAWTHPPFAGEIADGWIWGRGAMDDKAAVVGLFEAVERLLAGGFVPRRTFLLAFGHDEEVGGGHGAVAIARLLGERKVSPLFVLDEGLAVTEGIFGDVPAPVALIGIAEKGYLSVELTVASEGGHSSTPPRETAVGILSAAIHALEQHPARAELVGPARRLFEFIGPETGFATRLALANLWLFGPLVRSRLAASPASDALIRTTTAPTMLEGSVKENVLPARARGVVNFRIRPGETVASVLEHVRTTVADARVRIAALGPTMSEPSPESHVDSSGFAAVARTIRQVFPGAVVAPSLVLGATDSRHYAALSADVYRFLPFRVRPDDMRRPHGIDERIGVEDYRDAVRFYTQLIRNADPP
ncbi:MAG TPA: M20 family peptidase [Candidatus Binatus sp.]|nr:M20 family peptidase [Candidatus Binatus sp.]